MLPGVLLPNPLGIAGFRISYFDLRQLNYLFREIILDTQYMFEADNDFPFIIDCGSNIGVGILFFKILYPQARIIAFEPDPETFIVLRKNIEQNHLYDVDAYQCALNSQEGNVDFFRSDQKGALTMSIHQERQVGNEIIVPSRLLSPFITCEVDLLKMDIEGAETAVLPEIAFSGKLSMVKQLHLEYHHHIKEQKDELSLILKLLEDNNFGYRVAASTCRGKLPTRGAMQDVAIFGYRKA